MAFKKTEILQNIKQQLASIGVSLGMGGGANLLDDHVVAEDVFAGLLNLLKGWQLENLNKHGRSYPGIDLGDRVNRVAVQVTTELNTGKIRHTLKQSDSHHYEETYDDLYILSMQFRETPYLPRASYKSRIRFDPRKDILTLDGLYREIAEINDLDRLDVIRRYLDAQLMGAGDRPAPPAEALFVGVPEPPRQLVGRENQVAGIAAALTRNEGPAMPAEVLQGRPGVGKSALAAAVAHDQVVRAHFSGGVLWAGLGPDASPALHLNEWAAALGVDVPGPVVLDRLQDAIRRASGRQKILIVIDDAWELEPAETLRVGGPNCAYLLTTRDQVIAREFSGAGGERQVQSLEEDDAVALLGAFVPEIVQAYPGETLGLVRATGGLPLAVTLLGGYLASKRENLHPEMFPELNRRTLQEMGDPKKRLALFRAGLGGRSGEINLQETIELSVDALPRRARTAFSRLGAFAPRPATFSREAAERVTRAVPETLALLAAHNLLDVDGRQFAMHQVLADAARQGVKQKDLRAHQAYYLELANRDREDWRTIEGAWPQIRRAWENLPEDAGLLEWIWTFQTFLKRRGLNEETIAWMARGLEYTERSRKHREDRIVLLNVIGGVYSVTGEPGKALESYEQAQQIAKELGDMSGVALSLNNIGQVHGSIGQLGKSLENHEAALAIFKKSGDLFGQAAMFNNIGSVYLVLGKLDQAMESFEQALPIQQDLDDRDGVVLTLNNISQVHRRRGEPGKSLEFLQKALPIAESMGDRGNLALLFNNIGQAHYELGEPAKALEYYQQALAISAEVGGRGRQATALNNIGLVHLQMGERQKALAYFRQALEIHETIGSRIEQATALSNIGGVYREMGEPAKALENFRQALAIQVKIGDVFSESLTQYNMAMTLRSMDRGTEALELLGKAVALIKDTQDPNLKQFKEDLGLLQKEVESKQGDGGSGK